MVPIAVEQVRDISAYIALDKPSVAVEWADKIFNSVNRLKEFPHSGRVVPEIKRNEIREIVQGNYRVIYQIQQQEIRVLIVKSYWQKLKINEV